MKLGLKLFSTNVELIADAQYLKKQEIFDFVELYIIPNSFKNTASDWKYWDVPFVIHAPHSFHGTNLARADNWEMNLQNLNEAQLFAHELRADFIIVHGGHDGSFDETIRQLRNLKEFRIVLENQPKTGVSNEQCAGWSPSEFRRAISEDILYGTALDFGHVACTAKSLGINIGDIIAEFMEFNPKIYHLSDGYVSSEKDNHLNFGKGDFNLRDFISVIPRNRFVTIETPRNPLNKLDDFVEDVYFLRKLCLQNVRHF